MGITVCLVVAMETLLSIVQGVNPLFCVSGISSQYDMEVSWVISHVEMELVCISEIVSAVEC
jgi:hypothetical protein